MADCKHERTVSVGGKCSDMSDVRFHDGTKTDGYMPYPDFGLGSGDYIEFTVCLDCHQVIGFDDAKYEEAREAAKVEAEEREIRWKERQARMIR